MGGVSFPSILIVRDAYIRRVRPFMRKQIIKAFTGQRRVGKSYLLFQLMQLILSEDPDANIIYINKEDLKFDAIKNATDLHDYVVKQMVAKKMNYVFIDEIQEIDAFEKALRSLLLREEIDLYCSGSNARLFSGELATMLSGRYIEINVLSLTYAEFIQFHKLDNTPKTLDLYFGFGGLPYLLHLPLEHEIVFDYLKNIYNTIVFRDVIDRHHIRNIRMLERLVLFLADNTGSPFSANSISNYLKSQQIKLAPNQVQAYIDYLVNAFLVHRVDRYDIKGKKYFETNEKYYFENLGIRHALVGYKPQDMGKILENVVYNQLLFNGWKVSTGQFNQQEIDFVCEREGEKCYIQVALRLDDEKTLHREFGNLLQVEDNFPKKVITLDEFSGNTFKGVEHQPIRSFLMEVN